METDGISRNVFVLSLRALLPAIRVLKIAAEYSVVTSAHAQISRLCAGTPVPGATTLRLHSAACEEVDGTEMDGKWMVVKLDKCGRQWKKRSAEIGGIGVQTGRKLNLWRGVFE